jgi:hypothetical protein
VKPTLEFHLLLLALRRPQHEHDLVALRDAMAAEPDWDCVLEGVRRHHVASWALAGLQACRSPDLPASAIAELRQEAFEAASRSLAQMREIARLSPLFGRSGIRMLVVKGVALSVQLYGNPTLRDARDIDLLVDATTFSEAGALLIGAGYRRAGPALSPRQAAAYRHWIKEDEYVHGETGLRVELHHRFSDNPALIACNFSELWREREEVEIAGAVVPTLPRRNLALYLCAHGAGHYWERLQWLADLAAALREPGARDAALVAVETAGLAGPMLHALVLAHDWLGLPVEKRHLVRARADRRVARLDRLLAHSYGAVWHRIPRDGSVAALLRYSLWSRLHTYALKRDWLYWGRQAQRDFVMPADWEALRLPDRLFWLFPLMRPVGWVLRRRQR